MGADDEIEVALSSRQGQIHADLTVGAKVASATKLLANTNICFQGMNLVGKGFRVTADEVAELDYDVTCLSDVVKPYRNARELIQGCEHRYVIDLFDLNAEEARRQFPALYQWLLDRMEPERDYNNRAGYREKWWQFGEARGRLRKSWERIERVILTPETSKHRVFAFVDRPFCPDHKLYAICIDNAEWLGVLSSEIHKLWALAAGGKLGVGNDPTWTNTTCFATFSFPALDDEQQARLRSLAEQLDAHRKRQQAAHSDLTLTGMYNVLEKLRSGEVLTPKERTIHEHGLVSVLRQLHDEIDAAVLDAYGWSDLLPLLRVAHGNDAPEARILPSAAAFSASGVRENAPATRDETKRAFDEAILERLVALNTERAAEEARGLVRWLRPDFQNPAAQHVPQQAEIETEANEEIAVMKPAVIGKPLPSPKGGVDQVRAVAEILLASPQPLSIDEIAARFSSRGAWKKRLPALLEMLVALGRARMTSAGYTAD